MGHDIHYTMHCTLVLTGNKNKITQDSIPAKPSTILYIYNKTMKIANVNME